MLPLGLLAWGLRLSSAGSGWAPTQGWVGQSLSKEKLENQILAHKNQVPWFVLLGKKLGLWNQTWVLGAGHLLPYHMPGSSNLHSLYLGVLIYKMGPMAAFIS